jgi:hypothetical protein
MTEIHTAETIQNTVLDANQILSLKYFRHMIIHRIFSFAKMAQSSVMGLTLFPCNDVINAALNEES